MGVARENSLSARVKTRSRTYIYRAELWRVFCNFVSNDHHADCTVLRETKMVPVELSDKIIDCLASRKSALAQCSLVCKTWAVRSRCHLWKTVTLECDSNPTKLSQFLDLLRCSPALASLISHLTLNYYREPQDEKYPRGIIFPLSEALPALESLSLESVRLKLSHAADIDPFPSVKVLSIKKTKFDNILHFHHFVHAFPSLTDLSVGPEVTWDRSDGTDVIEDCAFKIDRLQVGADDVDKSFITWLGLLRSVDAATLRIIHTPWNFFEVSDSFESAWDACIPNVRSLELDMENMEGNDDGWSTGPLLQPGNHRAIDLTNAVSLRDITATVGAEDPAEEISVLLHEILPSFPQDRNLESCTIVVVPYIDEYASSDAEDDDDDTEARGAQWAESFANDECPLFEDVRIPAEVLTIRLLHPLRWDEHLYEGILAIWFAGILLRLEYTAVNGVIHTYTPPDE